MRVHRSASDAFSLVEVVVAIGIITFCLIAILNLLSVGLDAGRKSSDDTVLSSVAAQLADEIKTSTNLTFPETRYFDNTGMTNTPAQSLYTCQIASAPVPGSELTSVSTNLDRITITFTWPKSAPAASQQSRAFYLTLPPR